MIAKFKKLEALGKNMGLVDKLKSAGKALALAGGLGGMAYNSGCTPLAIVGGAAIIAKSNRDAAEKQAQATRDATRIQAQNNNYNSTNTNQINRQNRTPSHTFNMYICRGDANNNGNIDLYELESTEEDTIERKVNIAFHSNINNRKGEVIKFVLRNKDLDLIKEEILRIDSDSWEHIFYNIPKLITGPYSALIESGNGFLGMKYFNIADDEVTTNH